MADNPIAVNILFFILIPPLLQTSAGLDHLPAAFLPLTQEAAAACVILYKGVYQKNMKESYLFSYSFM
ncbi:hypothetical protein DWX64_10155 [Clostridium sp. AF20-17LB]|nr:hypothetical protein DWX64_10155 [Clostridium sp. AF20-17LB]